ncbi:MAG: tRNA (adenosine(37)-N6)-dimethylallyltransferase MiaA [Christensenellales bacterium]|jgi:tRNA dimethylallyltransferase
MKKIIVILGPTGVGKSSVAVELALKINAEIISADSSQIYKGFDIGSGKITPEETKGVKHHLIDIATFDQNFNVALFKQYAEEKIESILQKGKNVIICGGTALYVKALVNGFQFYESERNDTLRLHYETLASQHGKAFVHEILKQKNPKRAEEINPNNLIKVIRALEIEEYGNQNKTFEKPKFEYEVLILNQDRQKLYYKINNRVKKMVQSGLFYEVESLIKAGATLTHSPFKSIGYKEVYPYFEQEKNLTESESEILKQEIVEKIKQNSRNYAKRQITFLKSFNDAKWFEMTTLQQTTQEMFNYLKEINCI